MIEYYEILIFLIYESRLILYVSNVIYIDTIYISFSTIKLFSEGLLSWIKP